MDHLSNIRVLVPCLWGGL